jgi:predicted nucleic acid-binding protein
LSFAIDVNLLVYASDTESPFHEKASAFIEPCVTGDEVFCLGWQTVIGYLRM